jgi:hypothetical protein
MLISTSGELKIGDFGLTTVYDSPINHACDKPTCTIKRTSWDFKHYWKVHYCLPKFAIEQQTLVSSIC